MGHRNPQGLVKFEHHAFPLDLAALNAEKIVRCASNPDAKFQLLTKIYKKQKEWAVGSDISKINELLIKIGIDSKMNENKNPYLILIETTKIIPTSSKSEYDKVLKNIQNQFTA